jgi:hypothetical protein
MRTRREVVQLLLRRDAAMKNAARTRGTTQRISRSCVVDVRSHNGCRRNRARLRAAKISLRLRFSTKRVVRFSVSILVGSKAFRLDDDQEHPT